MRIVCLSDTHCRLSEINVPDGDLLIHAGDLTGRGTRAEIEEELAVLRALPHTFKCLTAGNHDFLWEREPALARSLVPAGIHYLEDSETTLAGLRIWGSPVTPAFHNWAFNRERGPDIRRHWDKIPNGIDVLVTHGPPFDKRDLVVHRMEKVGCRDLGMAIARVRPALAIFGHIHEGYGMCADRHTTYVNAAICNRSYDPINPPIVLDWENL